MIEYVFHFSIPRILFFISEEHSVLVVGGYNGSNMKTAELIPNRCNIPSLPKGISWQPSLILTTDNNILLCGGTNNAKQCLELKENNWVHHSHLKRERRSAASIMTSKGIYMFGGLDSPKTWEWLPSGSSTWIIGGSIPDPSFERGCGIMISSSEILLIGGKYSEQRILKFNVDSEEWTEMDEKIQPGRYYHSCVVFKNYIIVSGGKSSSSEVLKSTQIINIDNLSLSYSSDMEQARYSHGLVVAYYNNQPTVLAIGGKPYTDSVEVWNPESKTWSLSGDLRLSEAKRNFGALSVPTRLVCP